MSNATRRNFLKSLVLAGLSVSTACYGGKSDNISDDEKKAYIKIYNQWVSEGLGDPGDYIGDYNLKMDVNDNFMQAAAKDFKEGRVFFVDGFVLSRFEAAVIANRAKLFV